MQNQKEGPRPSKKEGRVIQFIKSFGEALKLPTTVDAIGNVIIKKPVTKGMESKETVVLQSHLDMVHQKNADTTFDFDTQGIDMYVDGDWVKSVQISSVKKFWGFLLETLVRIPDKGKS